MEPLEEVVCELEDEFSGPVIDALSLRRGEVILCQMTAEHAVFAEMFVPVHISTESVFTMSHSRCASSNLT